MNWKKSKISNKSGKDYTILDSGDKNLAKEPDKVYKSWFYIAWESTHIKYFTKQTVLDLSGGWGVYPPPPPLVPLNPPS